MFKIFKKYAVLDVVETNDYEAYCMYEQVAGGDAGRGSECVPVG